jgi:hypothetical protein
MPELLKRRRKHLLHGRGEASIEGDEGERSRTARGGR